MTYSAKEIIDLARQLSQTQNSEAFSFQLLVHLLNNVYTGLYNELATSQAFMSEFRFTGTEADLPSDCYKIVSVARNSKYFYLNQSSNSYNIPGTYSIENGSIRINGENGGEYIVKYQTLPMTEVEVCGSSVFGNGYQTGTGCSQLAGFKLEPRLAVGMRYNYWLMSISSSSGACLVSDRGFADGVVVTASIGCRPRVLIG